MTCSQFDLKAWFLGEAAASDRPLIEDHLRVCQGCREELERLRLTQAALATVADEEPPRRIAFVSDKVFEPRGWQWLWNSAPRLGFAAAAMLSVAILVHAFVRPAPVVVPATVNVEAMQARIETDVANRLQSVVEKAVAEAVSRHDGKTAELLTSLENRLETQRRADLLAVQKNFEFQQKKIDLFYRASNDVGGLQ